VHKKLSNISPINKLQINPHAINRWQVWQADSGKENHGFLLLFLS
jgi:hypothetical protein